ncbi:MAG: glycine cleavage system protein GcvH [Candidatus Omnitrophica bacterium]|nr:glycine cleavage system protein GcvH [Candidatus Omnitrophota bacterium]MCA9415335.1 glycine cleavage system protein GcvH [Candidatus Omnitrophota bacterium]MCA9424950.1 glycine cleavage system protein GcvH [Candidatus Omnitrophota bacterium]MCA9439729.1 glycine cleavage system protein GcvH [Candidatus Omnitrophota bacterium]MCA9447837.1 glycine cleavage system protein GcvH [Candidatus Omnitrophota bacterium]
MNIPENLKYTESHEWVLTSDGEFVVGISDFAQHELTDIVFVDLPEVGSEFSAKDACCVVESTKIAADIYAPVSGKITAVNEELNDHPEWVNESPYDKGWLFKIEPSDESDLDSLMNSAEYQSHLDSE